MDGTTIIVLVALIVIAYFTCSCMRSTEKYNGALAPYAAMSATGQYGFEPKDINPKRLDLTYGYGDGCATGLTCRYN